MKALTLLQNAGITPLEIRTKCGVTRHGFNKWVRGEGRPNEKNHSALIELGASRGLRFLAEDFQIEKKNQ